MAYRRVLSSARALVVVAACTTCTSEQLVMVEPSFVEVTPADVSAIEGETIQLVGAVHDDQNNSVETGALEWSSSDESIATVDAKGLVTARAAGEVTIRATFEDVAGEAKVEVLRGPFVVVVPNSFTLYTSPGAAPAPQVVAVSNGGAGRLEQLITSVSYGGEPRSWLQPTLAATTAPTQLTLRVAPAGLVSGSYAATVSVASLAADAAEIPVVLNVAGFALRVTGPGTSVAETGTADQIGVVLSSQPSAPVVLAVTAVDPTEVTVSPATVRFTRANWDDEQPITVRGVDDIDDDGDQVTQVRIAVDGNQSPDVWEALPPRNVPVTTLDNDEPASLVVVETAGTTIVSESNATDVFTVALASPIAANVVVEIISSNAGEVAVISAASLTFAPGNWNVPQSVTLIGIDDFAFDGHRQIPVTVRVVDILSDPRYAGQARNVVVTNQDNEPIIFF